MTFPVGLLIMSIQRRPAVYFYDTKTMAQGILPFPHISAPRGVPSDLCLTDLTFV